MVTSRSTVLWKWVWLTIVPYHMTCYVHTTPKRHLLALQVGFLEALYMTSVSFISTMGCGTATLGLIGQGLSLQKHVYVVWAYYVSWKFFGFSQSVLKPPIALCLEARHSTIYAAAVSTWCSLENQLYFSLFPELKLASKTTCSDARPLWDHLTSINL